MIVRTDRKTNRQTDKLHELYVYVGLAQAHPNNFTKLGIIDPVQPDTCILSHTHIHRYMHTIVDSCSPCGWVNCNEAIQDQSVLDICFQRHHFNYV